MWTKGDLIRRLTELHSLQPGWDGHGTPIPEASAISAAEVFAEDWDGPVPAAGPGIEGDVELEWEQGSRTVLLQFREDGSVRLHAFDADETLVEVEDRAVGATERASSTVQSLLASGVWT